MDVKQLEKAKRPLDESSLLSMTENVPPDRTWLEYEQVGYNPDEEFLYADRNAHRLFGCCCMTNTSVLDRSCIFGEKKWSRKIY